HKSRGDHYRAEQQPDRRVGKQGKWYVGVGDPVEIGKGKSQHRYGNQYPDEGQQRGLREELKNQALVPGAYYLSDAHLLGPAGRLSGGKVHEVDAGYQLDQYGDEDQNMQKRR